MIMMRLIDADMLIEALRGIRTEFVKHPTFLRSDIEEGIDRGVGDAMQAIMEQPTVDAVPVVRCKDCKWRNEKWKIDDNYWCGVLKRYIWENFFCGFGDRRDVKG